MNLAFHHSHARVESWSYPVAWLGFVNRERAATPAMLAKWTRPGTLPAWAASVDAQFAQPRTWVARKVVYATPALSATGRVRLLRLQHCVYQAWLCEVQVAGEAWLVLLAQPAEQG